MPSSSMTLSIPPDPGDTARSCATVANITTIAEKSEEVTNVEEAEDVFTPKLKQPMIVPVSAAVSAAKRKHSSTSSVEKPGTFKAPYLNGIWKFLLRGKINLQ